MSDLPNLLKILRATASAIADDLEKMREEAQTLLDDSDEEDTSDLETAVEKIQESISQIDDISSIIEVIAEELEITLDD
jgi:ElaB/YqjD/DUF883 family membrane-anchored ribosome-binding protein